MDCSWETNFDTIYIYIYIMCRDIGKESVFRYLPRHAGETIVSNMRDEFNFNQVTLK